MMRALSPLQSEYYGNSVKISARVMVAVAALVVASSLQAAQVVVVLISMES